MRWWIWPLVLLALPLALIGRALWLLGSVLLLFAVWLAWCPRGRYALVVYSESPVWQEYFESQILPALEGRAAVLNWSERRRWKPSLAVALFHVFGGTREFNPLAIVFKPLSWPRCFRFYRAFRSFKHGRRDEVEKLRQQFLANLNELTPLNASAAE
jgi:hypothetical protein